MTALLSVCSYVGATLFFFDTCIIQLKICRGLSAFSTKKFLLEYHFRDKKQFILFSKINLTNTFT